MARTLTHTSLGTGHGLPQSVSPDATRPQDSPSYVRVLEPFHHPVLLCPVPVRPVLGVLSSLSRAGTRIPW